MQTDLFNLTKDKFTATEAGLSLLTPPTPLKKKWADVRVSTFKTVF